MFSSEAWLSNSSNFYNGVATQSLRFDDDSDAVLTRTPSTASNRKTFVFSAWIKRGNLTSDNQTLFIVRTSSSPSSNIQILDTNIIRIQDTGIGMDLRTSRVFRDVSSWYHIVMAIDTTQTTLSNRAKLYVNGTQETDFSTETYPPTINDDTLFNSTSQHEIGDMLYTGTQNFDGYMAEVNFIDGLSFFSDTSGTPNTSFNINSFGELKNGIWIAKRYTGSYGTNGFRLAFDSGDLNDGVSPITDPYGSATDVPVDGLADASGQGNHFDSSGIDAVDCDRTDSPENNHATLNPLQAVVNDNSTKPTLSDGALVMSTSTADYQGYSSTMPIPTEGKYAFKVKMNTESSTQSHRFGVGTSVSGNGIATDLAGNASGWHNAYVFVATVPRFDKNLDGAGQVNGSTLSPATVANDEIEFLVDMDNGTIDTKLNGSTYGTQLTGMPTDKPLFPFATVYESSSGTTTLTFTFDYTPSDSSYLTLCSANLPEPTISPNADTQADDHFNTVIYNGNNDATRTFDVGFVTDLAWFKARNQTGYGHQLYDSVRGVQKYLQSNTDGTEITNTEGVTDFDDNGLLKIGTDAFINESGTTMVIWNWKAGGTAVSNTDGSITSSVSANTDAGFSIVTYTGTGSSATIGHGLGATADVVIIKNRDVTSSWMFWCNSFNGNDLLLLDGVTGKITDSSVFDGTIPTSSEPFVFSVGTNFQSNGSGQGMVAYCFAEIEGFSKFGVFTGNNDDNGTFVFLGFRPAFVMIKSTDLIRSWYMTDNTRDVDNGVFETLSADSNLRDATQSPAVFDFLSNGFKLRHDGSGFNGLNEPYIYMAFAENPFKYANAR